MKMIFFAQCVYDFVESNTTVTEYIAA